MEATMYGWSEFTSEPESELFLSDPNATDSDSETLLELGARPDAAIRWSYIYDHVSVVQELPPSIEGHHYTGWLLFA
jgi:hypothetical protein